MFKNRLFLIGLGFGFILSGIFLSLFVSDNSNISTKDITVQELKDIAADMNLYVYSQKELNQIISDNSIFNEKKDNESTLYFTIEPNMSSQEIVDYLFEIDVINDKEEFIELLIDSNLSTKILAGEYLYLKDISDEELIELITNVKKEEWGN